MTSRPFDPLFNVDSLQRMQRELGRLFEGDWIPNVSESDLTGARGWRPRADVAETNDQYTYLIDVPGVELADIDVTIKRNTLSVSGQRENTPDVDYHERPSGAFSREFELPTDADEASVTASAKNGVLEITLKKLAQETARQVPVNKAV